MAVNRGGAPEGNQNGKRGTEWRDAIRWALMQKGPDKRKKIRTLALALVNEAEKGDVAALKEIGDRMDGKPVQAAEITGKNGGAIHISVSPTDERL